MPPETAANGIIKILHEFNERFERLTPVEALSEENRNPGGVGGFSHQYY